MNVATHTSPVKGVGRKAGPNDTNAKTYIDLIEYMVRIF